MSTKKESEVIEQVQEQEQMQEQQQEQVQEKVAIKDTKSIVKALIAKGCKKYTAKILNIKCTDVEANESRNAYTRVSITIDTYVPRFIQNEETGEFELERHNVIMSSIVAILGTMKRNEDMAFLANQVDAHREGLASLFIGGEVTFMNELVHQGEEWVNPFTTDENVQVFEHDVIINHIIGLKLSGRGQKVAEQAAFKMLGF